MNIGFETYDFWWWPYLFILLIGWLPTDIWRALGVLLSGRINEKSQSLIFVRSIATSLVAAVIAKLILFPAGSLAMTPAELRIAAALAGFVAFLSLGRRIAVGILVAETVLIGGAWLLGTF